MNLTKDTYLEIAKFADDKTIVQMLSVDKKFHDDEFFKLVFFHKYPLLLKFKKDEESWKDFYLRMVMYIAKLKEEFDLDYIPAKKFNPEKFYKSIEISDEDWILEAAEYLKQVKDIDFIRKFLLKYGKNLEFKYLIKRELKNRDLKRIKVFVDADIASHAFKKFYGPVYDEPIMKAIKSEDIDLLKILILPNIRKYDIERFIEYARDHNKKSSEKYLLTRI